MRSYVIATGVVFALVTLVHLWRILEEPHLGTDPWFLLVTLITAVLAFGAWRVARRPGGS